MSRLLEGFGGVNENFSKIQPFDAKFLANFFRFCNSLFIEKSAAVVTDKNLTIATTQGLFSKREG